MDRHCKFYSAVLSFYYNGLCKIPPYKVSIFHRTSTGAGERQRCHGAAGGFVTVGVRNEIDYAAT